MDLPNTLTPRELKLIAELNHHPGYLLLLDYLQARLDNLTDDLGNRAVSEVEGLAKLRYWQAFRDVFHTLKTQPQNFEAMLSPDERQSAEFLETVTLSPDHYLRMRLPDSVE